MSINAKEKAPLVSVIMPAYNAAPFIEEAIKSVIDQTMVDWELFVIDDCSTDDTLKIAQGLAEDDERIQVLRNDNNMGVARTRNRGIDLARGEYVALLDSDDYWYSAFLDKMVDCAKGTNADIVYSSYELVDVQNNKLCNDFIVPEKTNFEESIVKSVITCSTVLLKADMLKDNCFPTDVYHEDIALWFKLLRDGKIARGVTEVLAAYRQVDNSRSNNKLQSALKRWIIYRRYLKLPLIKCIVTVIKYGYYGLKKYKKI